MTTAQIPIEYALVRSTVRLLTGLHGSEPTSVGTGFYYQIINPVTNITKVLIVTNKHVIKGMSVVHFVVSSAPSITVLDEQQQPVGRTDHPATWPLSGNLYMYPDPMIDLCAIDVTHLLNRVIDAGRQLRIMFINSDWLPHKNVISQIRDIEQVLVVGYPKGLWDDYNNMPIARAGTTATHPLAHYQGKRDFLVDVAAFTGSSGSPVFSYEAPMFRQADGSYAPGSKVQLLGIVWGVIQTTTTGILETVEIPSSDMQIRVLQTSLNLARAVHADAILALEELVFTRSSSSKNSDAISLSP